MKLFLALTLLALTATANPNFEKIIGTDDLRAVNADGTNIPVYLRPLINAFEVGVCGCSKSQ